MPASLAARITAMPSSRDIRSYVRHEPSDMIDTSIPTLQAGGAATSPRHRRTEDTGLPTSKPAQDVIPVSPGACGNDGNP